jgi:undecaprenyl-diphosphatase
MVLSTTGKSLEIPNDSTVEQKSMRISNLKAERFEPSQTRWLVSRYWIPALSIIILTVVSLAPDTEGHRKAAQLFSGPIYKGFILLTVALLLLYGARRRSYQQFQWALDLIICTLLSTQGMHLLFHLPRPEGHAHKFSPGFPSAHTTLVFGLAWLILETYPWMAPTWFGMAIAVGWSRIAVHSHYPYQVLCGAVLGVALGWWVSHSPQGIIFPRCFRRGGTGPIRRLDAK